MAEPASLSDKIQKCLNDELNGDNVEYICQLLKSTKGLGYTRRIVEDIGKSPVKLFNEISRRGDIKETDYSLLLRILKEADLTSCAHEIEDIIVEHNQPIGPKARKRSRLSSFPDHGDYYPFGDNRKGLVAIINNFTNEEEDGIRYRNGTIEDQKEIVNFFTSGKFAHLYDVDEPGLNLCYNECEDFLDSLATKLKRRKDSYHSFFLFILSHGDENGVQTYCSEDEDPNVMAIEKITTRFNDSLPDCPKVFVFQACQGRHDNIIVQKDAEPPKADIDQPEESEEIESAYDGIIYMETGPPEAADMLTAFATVQGYKAYRVQNGAGSWYIQKLIKALEEAHKGNSVSSHMLDILTKVQDIVSKMQGKSKPTGRKCLKQMPCFQSSLRKKFYLLPPSLP